MRRTLLAVAALSLILSVPAFTAEPSAPAEPAPDAIALPDLLHQPTYLGGCSGSGARVQPSPSSAVGSGFVVDTTDPACDGGPRFPAGHVLNFTAVAAPGYTFNGWTSGVNCGFCVGSGTTCYGFTMPAALVVCIANFI